MSFGIRTLTGHRRSKLERGKGLYGIWSAGNLDSWVGREGPLVRDCLGGEEGEESKSSKAYPMRSV